MRQVIIGPGDYQRDEYEIGATDIEPGHLVEVTSAGQVVPHSTANGPAAGAFAIEDRDVGKTVEDTYVAADDENVHVGYPQNGTLIPNAWLADGESVDPGDLLVSNGDGTLQAYVAADAESGMVVAVAEESVAASGSDERVEVRSV